MTACEPSWESRKPAIIGCGPGDDQRALWRSMTSEYTKEYQKWPYQEKQPIRPPSNGALIYDASARHDMRTMYEDNFLNHPSTTRTACIRPQQNQVTKPGYFHCLSTYRDNYRDTNHIQMRQAFRPCPTDNQFGLKTRECQKTSVSHQTYRLYNKDESKAAKRDPIIIEPEKGGVIPVEASGHLQTTVQENFRNPGQQCRRAPIVPASAEDIHRSCRMDMVTTNRADFYQKKPHPTSPAAAMLREMGDRSNRQLNAFNVRTTFQEDYINHPNVRRPKSFKPPIECHVTQTPFLPHTVYSDDYKQLPYQGPPKPHILPGNLQLKSCPFQGSTQYSDEFIRPPSDYRRQKFVKPKSTRTRQGPFQDETSYRANFRQFDFSHFRKSFLPAQTYEPPTIPFQVESTAHAHYKGEPAPRSKICKPVTKPRIPDSRCVCVV